MAYPAKAIANYFLKLAKEQGETLSPMKIQKLVYFAHGWNLAITGLPLIDEQVEAWQYGPVIPSLYHEFKKFGSGAITSEATEFNFLPDGKLGRINLVAPAIDDKPDNEGNEFTKELIEKVWKVYKKFSGIQLSTMTHTDKSPWATTWAISQGRKNTDIPDSIIREHFIAKARENEQHGA